jgi:DNA-directed RNA polymerase specialized sigma24 family protein
MANNRSLPAEPAIALPAVLPLPRESEGIAADNQFDAVRFASAWPVVEARILRMLATHHCLPADRADIAQETAERLLRRRIPFADAADLGRYALATAHHAWVDHVRKQQPTVDISAAVETLMISDTNTTVANRLALSKMLADLSEEEMRLLDGDADGPQTRQDAVRANVQRHRLRNRLKQVVVGLLAVTALLGFSSAATRQGMVARHSPTNRADRSYGSVRRERLFG